MTPRRIRARILAVSFATWALLPATLPAEGTATRSPATPDNSQEIVTNAGGVTALNPGRTPVVSQDNYTSVTSVEVDADNGIIRGYSEFDMDADQVLPDGTVIGSTSTGVLSLQGTAAAAAPFDMTLNLALDGQFIVNDGQPSLLLVGNLNATTFSIADPLAGTIFQSQLIFELTLADGVYSPNTLFTGVQSPLAGSQSPFAGASATVINDVPGDLDAIISLTFSVQPGDSILISSVVSGIATAQPGDGAIDDSLDVRASAGAVDFSSSGVLGIVLPEGASIIADTAGDAALLANIVQVQPIPLPAALWLFAPALVAVAGRRRRA